VKERGPEHQKTFTIEARVGGDQQPEYVARGEGPSKKQAEQGAARKALEHLRSLENQNPKPPRQRPTSKQS
jgi:ribonuclease-3